jgi:uncharacterized lipoprotein YmbA
MSKSIPSLRCAVLIALLGAVLSACTGASPQVVYYSLLETDAAATAAPRHDQLVLSIGPVAIPDVLQKSNIATGGADGRYQLSEYHRWAGEVDRELARALVERLAGRLGTEQVYLYPGNQHIEPTFQVALDVLAMNGELGQEVTLSVRWTLIDPKGNNATLSRHSRFSGRPADGSHNAWVKVQRQNIDRLGEEIAAAISNALPKK